MISIRIIVDKTHLSKTGTWPVLFELYEETQHIRMPSGFVVKPSDWHGGKDPYDVFKKSYHIKDGNKMIGELHTLMMYKLRKLELEGKVEGKSLSEVRDILSGKSIKTPLTLNQKFKDEIKKKSKSTQYFYNWTLKNIQDFTNGKDVKFTELTVEWLDEFTQWMESRGNKINTRSIHLRNIRAVYNAAVKSNDADNGMSPFNQYSIKSVRKEKRFMRSESMLRFRRIPLSDESEPTLVLAKEMFLISFAMCGINLVDLYNLKLSDVQNGDTIVFQRTKIKFREPEPVRLKLSEYAIMLINRHIGHDGYLLCLHEKYKDYRNCYHTLQSRIRTLGAKIGEPDMTFYWARYSWATYASHLGIDEAVIGRALGHQPKSLAGQSYISFDWNRVFEASLKVIDWTFDDSRQIDPEC